MSPCCGCNNQGLRKLAWRLQSCGFSGRFALQPHMNWRKQLSIKEHASLFKSLGDGLLSGFDLSLHNLCRRIFL
jgi:hypothetical protein